MNYFCPRKRFLSLDILRQYQGKAVENRVEMISDALRSMIKRCFGGFLESVRAISCVVLPLRKPDHGELECTSRLPTVARGANFIPPLIAKNSTKVLVQRIEKNRFFRYLFLFLRGVTVAAGCPRSNPIGGLITDTLVTI